MICTRCEGTGFLNSHQIPACVEGRDAILHWIERTVGHDVTICDCCGDGDIWYGVPGEHYGDNDPAGNAGPYEYNGGLCECH